MKMIKFFWALSLLAFLGVSLLIYIYMPEKVNVWFDANGQSVTMMQRGDFFYASMMALLLVNISITVFGNSIMYFPKQLIWIPKKDFWLKSKDNRKELVKRTKGWTRGLATIFNLLLLAFVGVIFSYHYEEAPDLTTLLYVIPVLAIAWLVFFFFLFSNTDYKEA
ncbi:hypothetical protein V6R21_18190 [Limibacter armeniacum]|uniref:hypothetical protein n=1 Tax=Limibacter armeniacum TaxID=466084 RepID=UPI002FE65E2F